MSYTFFELQEKYKIIIPQIQRDYAQGRDDINNENKIKGHDFILKIIKVLTSDVPALNLDFIYGYTEKIEKNQLAFIPLDGQQRLTTLWLLHWYLSPRIETEKNGKIMFSITDELKERFKNFTYKTRNWSKRFCEELIDEYLPASDNISATIKDANWFMASWQNDPTVISMLNMLDAIQHQKFDKESAWKNLTENRKITFDYIDIKSDEFKLSDELYIKMNSRGKPLTLFENFKAEFSEILSSNDVEYIDEKLDYAGTQITYQEYFSFRIDSVWTDLFWNFVTVKRKDISICFMNFFTYIAQMCYFKDNLNKAASNFNFKKPDFSVFKRKDNILFLFNTLDFFYNITIDDSNHVNMRNICIFFESLFQKDKIDETYQDKIYLFEDKEVNLFERCLLEGNQFENRNRIILFCLTSYVVKNNLREVNSELRYFIRVVRNLLQATRQRNEISYNTNVRINSFGKYWKLFKQLMIGSNVYNQLLEEIDNKDSDISNDALNNEIEKAQIVVDNLVAGLKQIQAMFMLEEHRCFGGLIHNLNPKENIKNLSDWSIFVSEIWNCNDELIVASLIACDFSGYYTKPCRLGKMWFFGQTNNWNTILAGQSKLDDDLSKPIISLMNKYNKIKLSNTLLTTKEILDIIIEEFLCSLTEKNWQYYFCKYRNYFLKKSNYYSWKKDEFEHEILGSTGFNPLIAYHINPYVKTVSNLLDNNICRECDCNARYSDESCVKLKNGFRLYSKKDGWYIIIPDGLSISDELKIRYHINERNTFSETNGKDRIEIAVEFCKDLMS